MSEFTPTTEQVRNLWSYSLWDGNAYQESVDDSDWDEDRMFAQFDRWLQQTMEEVWDDGFESGATWTTYHHSGISSDPPTNPYSKEQ